MEAALAKLSKPRKSTWQDVEPLMDILSNILSRLPAEDLVDYKRVSSLWRCVIRSPDLVEKQLRIAKEDPIFIILPYIGPFVAVYLIDANGNVLEQIDLPGCGNLSFFRLKCVFNGLVCFINCPFLPDYDSDKDYMCNEAIDIIELEIRIFNPCTREMVLLPRGSPSVEHVQMGIAFGPGMAEYKVYRIFSVDSDDKSEDPIILCEVYTPSSGTWRNIGRAPEFPTFTTCVFLGGKVYWFLSSEENEAIPGSLLIVDMDEHFTTMNLPMELTTNSFITELDGRLCIVCFHDDRVMRVWLLKYENLGHTWEDFHSTGVPEFREMEVPDAVAGRKNDFFVVTSWGSYYIYDIGSRTWNNFDYDNEFDVNTPGVFPFTGSLLPCNGVLGPQF